MPSTSRLLPEHIVCKITQRDNIRRANPCDPALKPLNLEITSDISLHKQNLWKEHLNVAMHKDWSLQCHFLVLKSGPPFLTVVERGRISNLHYD